MGTATNSPPAMALEKNTQLEANWLAVPIFREPAIDKGKQIR